MRQMHDIPTHARTHTHEHKHTALLIQLYFSGSNTPRWWGGQADITNGLQFKQRFFMLFYYIIKQQWFTN